MIALNLIHWVLVDLILKENNMKINKSEIKKMILKEMAMVAVRPMTMQSHYQEDSIENYRGEQEHIAMPNHSKMSKEACCIAIKAIAECCECPDTKASILQLCNTIR
jgi:hypothetical protein